MADNCTSNADSPVLLYVLGGALSFTVLMIIVLSTIFIVKYRNVVRQLRLHSTPRHHLDPCLQPLAHITHSTLHSNPSPETQGVEEEEGEEEVTPVQKTVLKRSSAVRSSSRKMWKTIQQSPRFTKSDVNLLQLIKAGKEGVFYKARMTRGTCKGHTMVTCKISKEGVRMKHVDTEVAIMRKLVHHKNILQLLEWNTTEEPFVLIMEFVSYGTLRTFLQMNRHQLTSDPELQSLFTIASYHIALALQHLRSKSIVHCDLALRNIMVDKFPWEVKLAEFGLARDLTKMTSRRSSRWRNPRQRVPLRWYPPEYFKNNYYSFKGDVWAFGIVLWEMQTFGTLPYPSLQTSESVVYHICIGHKNSNPDGCRPEILHVMKDCWLEPHTLRPSFSDIVRVLESVMENDADYVDVESPEVISKQEAERMHSLQTGGATLNETSI